MRRVKISRTKKDPPGTRRVCRPSRWGNPFKVGDDLGAMRAEMRSRGVVIAEEVWSLTIGSRAFAVLLFEEYLKARLRVDPIFLEPLRGADALGCYCDLDEACHADVIIRYIYRRENETLARNEKGCIPDGGGLGTLSLSRAVYGQ